MVSGLNSTCNLYCPLPWNLTSTTSMEKEVDMGVGGGGVGTVPLSTLTQYHSGRKGNAGPKKLVYMSCSLKLEAKLMLLGDSFPLNIAGIVLEQRGSKVCKTRP